MTPTDEQDLRIVSPHRQVPGQRQTIPSVVPGTTKHSHRVRFRPVLGDGIGKTDGGVFHEHHTRHASFFDRLAIDFVHRLCGQDSHGPAQIFLLSRM